VVVVLVMLADCQVSAVSAVPAGSQVCELVQ
jgi:hypothetical protein